MSDGVLIGGGLVGVLALIAVAGLLFDRLRRHRSPSWHAEAVQRRADQTLRYYRDVGDSSNSAGW